MIKRLREWVAQSLALNFTTTLATATSTKLSFAVKAGEIWAVTTQITAECSTNRGVKYAVSAPLGSTVEGWLYGQRNPGQFNTERVIAVNTLTGTALHTAVNTPTPDQLNFLITAGAVGSIAIAVASQTAGDTTTLFSGSSLSALRVN